jgi:hypothetical protein
MTREVPGFVATRLQEAVWREALHMIANGEATPEQIDIAMVNGPGPRWAFAGPCMTYHIGGGEGGMEYCLDVFGPALKFRTDSCPVTPGCASAVTMPEMARAIVRVSRPSAMPARRGARGRSASSSGADTIGHALLPASFPAARARTGDRARRIVRQALRYSRGSLRLFENDFAKYDRLP